MHNGWICHPFPLEKGSGQTGVGVPCSVHGNLMPEKVRDLAVITEQKLEGNLEASLTPSRKESLGIMTDGGGTSGQALNTETQPGGHMCQRLQGPG